MPTSKFLQLLLEIKRIVNDDEDTRNNCLEKFICFFHVSYRNILYQLLFLLTEMATLLAPSWVVAKFEILLSACNISNSKFALMINFASRICRPMISNYDVPVYIVTELIPIMISTQLPQKSYFCTCQLCNKIKNTKYFCRTFSIFY